VGAHRSAPASPQFHAGHATWSRRATHPRPPALGRCWPGAACLSGLDTAPLGLRLPHGATAPICPPPLHTSTKGPPRCLHAPFLPPPFSSSLVARAHPTPLPSASRPLQLTGATSSPPDLAAVLPPTHPPDELRPHRHYLSLEPRLTFPSSSCRTAGTSSSATRASPPPRNEATHRCHRPPHH
jgi:hypothetical protein